MHQIRFWLESWILAVLLLRKSESEKYGKKAKNRKVVRKKKGKKMKKGKKGKRRQGTPN